MSRPIIGILGRPENNELKTSLISVMDCYRKSLIELGANPILLLPPQNIDYNSTKVSEIVPITYEEKRIIVDQLNLCDGVLLPGGEKIYPHEYFIIEWCIKKDIPILGICLGMQVMASYKNDYLNTDILLDNKKIEPEKLNHYDLENKISHKVNINNKSSLYNIIKTDCIEVNSLHKYCVNKTYQYDIVGYSEDGIIEAIEYKNNKFNIGVQWHPERLLDNENNRELLLTFIKYANLHKKDRQKQETLI